MSRSPPSRILAVVYLSTLSGTTFDTTISYRGASCPGSAVQCVDDSCGVLQTQLAQHVSTWKGKLREA